MSQSQKAIANRLRQARIDAGFETAKQFIEKYQLPASAYGYHENGTHGIRARVATTYCEQLNISLDWLYLGVNMNNLQIIKEYQSSIWDDKDIGAIDNFFRKDAIIHSPVETTQGTDKMKAIISQWHKGFPNMKVYWDDFICEEDKVVSRWHAEGIQSGEFLGNPPTEKPIMYSGITVYQLDDEKINEYWAFVDMNNILKQLSN